MAPPNEGRFEQEYFETVYPDYARQNPPRKLRFYRRHVERFAMREGATPRERAPQILDIGCAFGAFLSSLDPTWERFGTDVSRFAVDRAKAALPGATFAVADIDKIPFPGPFDIITAFDVIEHIPSLDTVAASVNRLLGPGGHFMFVVPVYDGVTGPIIRALDKDETHVHKDSRDVWLGWANRHFEVLEWRGLLRYLVPAIGYLHGSTRVWRKFTPAILVVARRRDSA